MLNRIRATAFAICVCFVLFPMNDRIATAQQLSGTKPIEWEEDLSSRLMDGAHQFVERKIDEAPKRRGALWHKDFSSPEAYVRSIEANREHFKTILGIVDPRKPPEMERYGNDENPALVAETEKFRIFQVRWPVLDGIWGCGLLVQPVEDPVGHVVVIPDADETPEELLSLVFRVNGVPAPSQGIRRLAENGYELVILQTISRSDLKTDDPQLLKSDQTYREWIYRQAYHMGRHPIGFEVQMALSAVDWFHHVQGPTCKIGICGYAEGALVAFYAAAVDPRIDAALVSGYFNNRQEVWKEPIYRNVWSLLKEFGDAEIAGLVLPRSLVIEHCAVPEIQAAWGHKGEWHTPDVDSVLKEVQRIEVGSLPRKPKVHQAANITYDNPYSENALNDFADQLTGKTLAPLTKVWPVERRRSVDPNGRHDRLFQELENYVQGMILKADHVREKSFLLTALPELANWQVVTDPEKLAARASKFVENSKAFRERYHEDSIGRFDEPLVPLNPRSRLIKETDKWKAYDIVLDVYPEMFAWGILVVPKDLKAGEKRPVVVCQHGRNGVPREMLDTNTIYYGNIAAKLAERGFITFAPHNLYRDEDRYRWLNRKANNVKATLFSFIIPSHDQILRWLDTLPFVDGKRIAFYGLSYGGETAVRVPTILEKYSLSICSADFNQWTRKVAATDQPFSFMRTIEWEMPYWNLGNTFDYAEMAYLMAPRPFMVERGHLDGVGKDQWVAHEFAKVRWLYAQLGIEDRTEIEFFQNGHVMNASGTVEFLHKHLNLPRPVDAQKN